MTRRESLALLGSALAMWPVAALARTVDRIRRIGFLSTSAQDDAESAKRRARVRKWPADSHSTASTRFYRGGMFCAPWNRFPGSNLALVSASRA